MPVDKWTREQTIVALNLYCKIPFNKVTSNHPEIMRIAKIIGRSPNSVKMKIGNFGSFDPELKKRGISGLENTSILDKTVWDEFINNWEKLAYESEQLVARFLNQPIEKVSQINIEDLPAGKERETLIRARVNQSFFRCTVLSSYNFKCCITGLAITDLLVASHIKGWSIDIQNRLNPHNGLCLNYLHDKAFDRGYFTVTPDYRVKISRSFDEYEDAMILDTMFLKYDNQSIVLPNKFFPNKEFLSYHYEHIFKK